LQAVAAVGDVVEIGIPFSDPMADGMTIQRSSFEALQKGVRVAWIFDELEKSGGIDTPLVMMSYLNPLLAFGYTNLAKRAQISRSERSTQVSVPSSFPICPTRRARESAALWKRKA
jgi:tryptophan synthase alpha subunit